MKFYLAAGIVGNDPVTNEIKGKVARLLEEQLGLESTAPFISSPNARSVSAARFGVQNPSALSDQERKDLAVKVYEDDVRRMLEADVFIALLTPAGSYGVGVEIAIASSPDFAPRRVILVPTNKDYSSMAVGRVLSECPDRSTVIQLRDDDDFVESVRHFLGNTSP